MNEMLMHFITWCYLVSLLVSSAHVYKVFQNLLDSNEFPFQRMVVERRYTGGVYLGGVNRLYQLNADLQLAYKVETGPVYDSPECPSNSVCENVQKQTTNNYNKALTIYQKNNKLIVCGSIWQGLCRLYNVYNITTADPIVPEPVVANDKDSSSIIFVAPGPPDLTTTDTLYVASTFTDLGSYRNEVPAVATLSLQHENLFKVAHRTINSETQILVQRSKRKSYKIDYVYGFHSGNYSYFLTRQQTTSNSPSPYQSKLVRLCQKDIHYYSYTEIPLECKSFDDGMDFNLVQSAYVGKAGYDLARNLSITTNDDVLFAVFVKGDGEVYRDILSTSSAMCVYSLRSIEAKFDENIKNCAKGLIMRGLAFFKKEIMCRKTQTLDTSCGTAVNYPLGGNLPIMQKAAYITRGPRLISIVSTTTHMYTVVFMGTDDGQLKKVVIETASDANEYDSVDLKLGRTPIIDLQLDTSGEFLYILTASSLSKVKPYECDKYSGCLLCLQAKDPYCGWCASQTSCIAKSTCKSTGWISYKDSQCTIITKVTPEKVPITLAQFLNLEIQNMPVFTGYLSCVFTLAGRKLITGAQKNIQTSNLITCTTPQTSLLPPIPTGSDSLSATLSIQIDNGADFAVTNFTFFDCSSYKSCTECVTSTYLCDWCIETSICSHNANDTCRKLHLINSLSRQGLWNRQGPSFCPRFVAVDDIEVYTASGTSKEIIVRTVNLIDFQFNFLCRFEFGSRTFDMAARKIDRDQIKCSSMNFSYSDSSPNATSKFSVLWNEGKVAHLLDNPQNVRVIMYKCEHLAENCGLCLSLNSKFKCGWCSERESCSMAMKCESTQNWLNRSAVCPNPKIIKFTPRSGPVEGGTRLIIDGINLGRTFQDIQSNVRVNYIPCTPIESLYEVSTRIVCETGPADANKVSKGSVVVQIREDKKYLAISSESFEYVDPIIVGFAPKIGPLSGGTVVTVDGDNLNTGLNISAVIAGVQCVILEINQHNMKCRTGPTTAIKTGGIVMKFDNADKTFDVDQFKYDSNPTITTLSRYKSIVSGGLVVDVFGTRFDLIQEPKFLITYGGKEYFSTCKIETGEKMRCVTPKLPTVFDDSINSNLIQPMRVDYKFILDGVKMSMNSMSSSHRDALFIYPDPSLNRFVKSTTGDHVKYFNENSDYLIVRGLNLNSAVNLEDVKVYIGAETCNVSTWNIVMTCIPPPKQPKALSGQSGSPPEVIVVIGEGYLNFSLGYLSYKEPGNAAAVPIETIPVIIVALSVFLIAVSIMVFVYQRILSRQHDMMKQLRGQVELNNIHSEETQLLANVNAQCNPNSDLFSGTDISSSLGELHQIPRDRITLIRRLGEGAFGEVYEGTLSNPIGMHASVAVKTVPKSIKEIDAQTDFYLEALIMSKFSHPNIVKLIGVCFDTIPYLIVVELLAGGDLKSFLQEFRQQTPKLNYINTTKNITMLNMLQIALDIAEGCEFLEDNHFIHCDIATRNCLLTAKGENRIAKIADFGMSRNIYRAGYYQRDCKTLLPVRWMPPEAILDYIFTSKTDVWSFGILLWEIFTFGCVPYTGLGNQRVIQLVNAGGRLESPTGCPIQIYQIMSQCWHAIPEQRPNFSTIKNLLISCIQEPLITSLQISNLSPTFQESNLNEDSTSIEDTTSSSATNSSVNTMIPASLYLTPNRMVNHAN